MRSSRREFLKITVTSAVGGGLAVEFGLPARSHALASVADPSQFAPNAFLRIDRTGAVTFVMPVIEMGQGTYTSLPMLIAEELEVDVDKVIVEHSPPDDVVYANPLLGAQITGASTSIRAAYLPLRRAGATARTMLVAAAAQQWGVEVSTCHAENGAVVHIASKRRLPYGTLVDAAAKLQVPDSVMLKSPEHFRLIGTPHRRLEGTSKVAGAAKFGIDARPMGMKFAVIAMSPTFGGRLLSISTDQARAVQGVTQIVELDDAVAIVAMNTWAAKRGLVAASPEWEPGPNADVSSDDVVVELVAASKRMGAVARREADAVESIERAERRLDVSYQQPFLAHAAMEPMNCTVHLTKEACDIWVGTQIPGITQAVVMSLTGLERAQVRIHNHLLGGGFGRRLEFDGTVRAVQVAQHVAGPLQVIWSREEDIQHDMYRPYYYDRLSAGLNSDGYPIAWWHRIVGSSVTARFSPSWMNEGVDPDAVDGSADQPYEVDAVYVDWVQQEPPGVPTAFWRGVGVTHGTFVVESFIDELAAYVQRDPLDYRLALLKRNPRAGNVLQIAANLSAWGQPLPDGQGRGISLCIGFGSFIAQVVQVSVSATGVVRPTHVWCAVDCGVQVNPDTVRAQMEGGIIFGLSAAMFGEISIKHGRVEQTNFGDYRVLRMNESPEIDVHLVDSMEAPGGIGEPGTSCVMPALTNGIFAAVGKRIRNLPIGNQVGAVQGST